MKQIQRILQESTCSICFLSVFVVWFFFLNGIFNLWSLRLCKTETFYCFNKGIKMDLRYILEEGEKKQRDGT